MFRVNNYYTGLKPQCILKLSSHPNGCYGLVSTLCLCEKHLMQFAKLHITQIQTRLLTSFNITNLEYLSTTVQSAMGGNEIKLFPVFHKAKKPATLSATNATANSENLCLDENYVKNIAHWVNTSLVRPSQTNLENNIRIANTFIGFISTFQNVYAAQIDVSAYTYLYSQQKAIADSFKDTTILGFINNQPFPFAAHLLPFYIQLFLFYIQLSNTTWTNSNESRLLAPNVRLKFDDNNGGGLFLINTNILVYDPLIAQGATSVLVLEGEVKNPSVLPNEFVAGMSKHTLLPVELMSHLNTC